MWMIELTKNTATDDSRIGSHSALMEVMGPLACTDCGWQRRAHRRQRTSGAFVAEDASDSAFASSGTCRLSRGGFATGGTLRPDRFLRGFRPLLCGTLSGARARLLRERLRSIPHFALLSSARRAPLEIASQRPSARLLPLGEIPLLLRARARRRSLLRRQLDSGSSCLGKTDRDRLLRRPRPVLPFAHVLDLFTHELSRLRRRRLPFPRVLSRSLERFAIRHVHTSLVSLTSPSGTPRGMVRTRRGEGKRILSRGAALTS